MVTWTCADCETVNGPNDARCLVCATTRAETERRAAAVGAAAVHERPAPRTAPASGRRRRGPASLVAALCLALVLVAVAAAVVAAGSGGGDGGSSSGPGSGSARSGSGSGSGEGTPPAEAPETTPAAPPAPAPVVYDRSAYTLTLPPSWGPAERSVAHEGYVESRWHPAGRSEVTVLVDHTAGVRVGAERAAADVRAQVIGYRELGWGPATLGGTPAWRWDFEVGGKRKIDWFVVACQTGYALLASAPPTAFDHYEARFERIADSLRPSCS